MFVSSLEGVRSFSEAPDRHRLRASGVSSVVYDDGGDELGHVSLLDLDGVSLETARDDARELPGVAVVCRSGADGWLVWGLSVRPFDAVGRDARRSSASTEQVEHQIGEGRYVARVTPKIRETGEVYRDRPVPVEVHPRQEGDRYPVSGPHTRMLEQLAEKAGRLEVADSLGAALVGAREVGRTVDVSHYQTLSDELREHLDGLEPAETGGERRG